MKHVACNAIDVSDVEACVKHVQSLKSGKDYTSVWCNNLSDVVRLAFDNDFNTPIRTQWAPDGVSQASIGRVFIRDAGAYGVSPADCVELAEILGERRGSLGRREAVMRSRPSSTAKQVMVSLSPETLFWCDAFDTTEKYETFRRTVPKAFFKYEKGVYGVRGERPCVSLKRESVTDFDSDSIVEIDMNGAYRWAMTQSLPWPTGGFRHVEKKCTWHGVTRAIVRSDTLGILRKDCRMPNWRDNECLNSSYAVRLCLEYGSDIEVISSIEPKKMRPMLMPFVAFLDGLGNRCPNLKPAVKRIANSAYGRMHARPIAHELMSAQKLETREVTGEVWRYKGHHLVMLPKQPDRVVNPVAAGTISAMVTDRLLEARKRFAGRTLYSDTDNIVYHGSVRESDALISGRLGDFKVECVGNSVWQAAPKQRAIYGEGGAPIKVSIAGVPLREAAQLATMRLATSEPNRASIPEVVSLGYKTDDIVTRFYQVTDDGSITVRIDCDTHHKRQVYANVNPNGSIERIRGDRG